MPPFYFHVQALSALPVLASWTAVSISKRSVWQPNLTVVGTMRTSCTLPGWCRGVWAAWLRVSVPRRVALGGHKHPFRGAREARRQAGA